MVLDRPDLTTLVGFAADVCIIGSGSVGVTVALALGDRGFRVVVLECGGVGTEPAAEDLARAENLTPDNHFEPHATVARRLGGTSNLWAGRCVPFDAIDFRARSWLGLPAWPIAEADLAPYLAPALDALGAGAAVFESPPVGISADNAFRSETLERWSNAPKIQKRYAAALKGRQDVLVALHTTVLGFRYDGGCIDALEIALGRRREELPVRVVLLAAGGNASTRLLLLEQARDARRFGGPNGPLGRFYMGHLGGQIADIIFERSELDDELDYHVDACGTYVRRRLVPAAATQETERLANIAFWPVVPKVADSTHRSGPLSAIFLALSVAPLARQLIAEPLRVKHVGAPPYRRTRHLKNVALDLPRTLSFAPAFLWRTRVAKPRLPGFFLANRGRRYGLEYHAEQMPNAESRLTLSGSLDDLGQRRLRIDLRFTEADAEAVVRAHAALEAWLLRNRLATLEHFAPPDERASLVLANAQDGLHQIGTIRMAATAADGIVSLRCRSFDAPNLFVVSTAVLPSSGQANPTLTAVQLGLRLADDLAAGRAYDNGAGAEDRLLFHRKRAREEHIMRRVTIGATGIETSCLGFGCASLGSRVGEEPGRRALSTAFDAGVTWFDLAPIYGAGRAEEIVGRFLRGRRDQIQLCSKVGLAMPGDAGGLKAALMPVARAAVQKVPALRGLLRRSGVQAAKSLPLTPELLTSTLEGSLRRLGTDYLDLYALHSVAAAALTEPVLRSLEDILASGKVRAIAMASDEEGGLAAIRVGAPFAVVQVEAPYLGAPDRLLPAAAAAGFGAILHSVLGIGGSFATLQARAARNPTFRAQVGAAEGNPERELSRALLARAFALNPNGVVLVSMFSPEHLAEDLAVASVPPDAAAATRLDDAQAGC